MAAVVQQALMSQAASHTSLICVRMVCVWTRKREEMTGDPVMLILSPVT